MRNINKISIAIDGPAGAGKSTVAKRISKILDVLYLDTGAMYRAAGLKALSKGIRTNDADAVTVLADDIDVDIKFIRGEQRIFLDGKDVTADLRTSEVSVAASDVSAVPAIRIKMVDIQRRIAAENSVVMDGRDIGTYVLPDADLKIFLTASLEERTARRFNEMLVKDQAADKEKIRRDIEYRDGNDSSRAMAPLKKAEDAIEIDTTGLPIETVVETILEKIRPQLGNRPMREKVNKDRFREAVRLLIKIIFGIIYRVKIIGQDNIPAEGPALLCPNHVAELDMFVIGYRIKRLVRWMAKSELFRHKLLGSFISRLGAFPVKRGKNDVDSIKTALKLLEDGHIVGVFPEGTRMKNRRISRDMKVHRGAVMLALKAKVPVIPVAVRGNYAPFTRITVIFGKPFTLSSENDPDRKYTNDEMRIIGRQIMDRIYAMVDGREVIEANA